jgi:hypothetical protein
MEVPVSFIIAKESLGPDGIWNPSDEDGSLQGGLQVNLIGNKDDYYALADWIRQFADQDSSSDSDFHEHFEGVMSADGRTRLHLIIRKDDIGNGAYGCFLPKNIKAERTGAANPHACGTSGISAAEQPRMPEASRDT